MSGKTSIEWTDYTWNPVSGCSRVSEGCRNCYAERVAARFSKPGLWAHGYATLSPSGPRWTGRVDIDPNKLIVPTRWKKPRRIFVNSMSDLFHEKLPFDAIDTVFATMAWCSHHTFQILTKRPERMREYIVGLAEMSPKDRARRIARSLLAYDNAVSGLPWPLPNVWLGTSAENQEAADARIPHLVNTPAAIRFISAEPLLGPINFPWLKLCRADLISSIWYRCASCQARWEDATRGPGPVASAVRCPKCGGRALPETEYDEEKHEAANERQEFEHPDAWALHWIIVGGESGPNAREMNPEWALSIRDQCEMAGVPFFFKQWGGPRPKSRGRLLVGREWNQSPRWRHM